LNKINVLQVCNYLGLGGTEKVLQLLAANLNRDHFSCSVCAADSLGPRADLLKGQGIEVDAAGNDLNKLTEILINRKIDLLHWHSSGEPEPFVLIAAKQAKVPVVVRTNVFGADDPSSLAREVSVNVFVSKMCFLRYQRRHKLKLEDFYRDNKVIYNPVEFLAIEQAKPDSALIEELKISYGIGSKDPVIGRIGRSDDSKFGAISIDMMKYLVKLQPKVKFIAVGITQAKLRKIRHSNISGNFVFVDPTFDSRKLYQLYHLLDLYVHSAPWGESFGCSIAEAMACAKPVVTHSTPHWDNAQIELVDHGVTGLVANTPRLYAQAVDSLLSNPEKAKCMGEAGYLKAKNNFDILKIARQTEKLYLDKLVEKGYSFAKELMDYHISLEFPISLEEITSYQDDYKRRLKASFGKENALEISGYFADEALIFLKALVRK